jgi:hypothetical protein
MKRMLGQWQWILEQWELMLGWWGKLVGSNSRDKLLSALGALLLLSFLFVKSTAVDPDAHVTVSSQLRQLRQLDFALNQYVLQSRLGLLNNYDPVVITQHELTDVIASLQTDYPELFDLKEGKLSASFSAYLKTREEKQALIEAFKSHNAVLRNSLRYLPLAVQQFIEQGGYRDGERLKWLVESLQRDLLVYNFNPDTATKTAVLGYLSEIRGMTDSEAVRARQGDLESLLRHASIVVGFKDEMDAYTAQILAATTVAQGDNLYNLYIQHFEETQLGADLYRMLLTLFSLSVLGYAALSLLRLNNARNELKEAMSVYPRNTRWISTPSSALLIAAGASCTPIRNSWRSASTLPRSCWARIIACSIPASTQILPRVERYRARSGVAWRGSQPPQGWQHLLGGFDHRAVHG